MVKNSFRLAACGVAAVGLVACGSASPSATSPTGAPTSGAPTQPRSSSPTPTPVSTAPKVAANLTIDNQVRAELIIAGAKARGLNASDFTSLRTGMTYYAYDPATQTYWAGGELVPSPHSYRAEVSSQDDGGYTLFTRPAFGSWSAMDEGMAGPNSAPGNAGCRLSPPPSVLALWGWPANSCHPSGV